MDNKMDSLYMERAVELSKQAVPVLSAYSVGALLVYKDQILTTGYSRERPGNTHAEEVCLIKAAESFIDHQVLQECTIYSTMEPCGERLSGKEPCAFRIIKAGIKRVVIGAKEPSTFIQNCAGLRLLQNAGIEVVFLHGYEGAYCFIIVFVYENERLCKANLWTR